jgi:SAM-dependent methyltransferase
MSTHSPHHQFSPLTRFDDRARDYANYRPNYPPAAIDAILSGLNSPEFLTVTDLGAGTGISARQLADRGAQVLALEPNAAMRRAAMPHERVKFIDATAEKTCLPDSSVDLVTAFQSFHWFEPHAAIAEAHRILRASGRLALCWNERDSRNALMAGYDELVREAAGDHPMRSGVPLSGPLIRATPLFRDARELEFPNSKRMTCAALIGSCLSGSYIPQSGPAHDKLMDGLRRLHEKFAAADGCVEMIYRTEIFLAERA